MKRLRLLSSSLLLLLLHSASVIAQQSNYALTDFQCSSYFRNYTFTDSPWLWTKEIRNYNYHRFYRANPSLLDPNVTIDEQDLIRVLQRASSVNRTRVTEISYPIAIEYNAIKEQCGSSSGLYEWALISDTLTTWILPIIGLIVSMPWESNRRTHTILMIFRWLGSPFASLTYIFWNLRLMGRAAAMVDLGVPRAPKGMSLSSPRRGSSAYKAYKSNTKDTSEGASIDPGATHENGDDQGRNGSEEDLEAMALATEELEHMETFVQNRDSFGILCAMNQYKLSSSLPLSEQTLRKNIITALFMTDLNSGKFGLDDTRRNVAEEIRRLRKRGVVPVLASLGWFFFALAISLYKAFGEVGDNATAHNLAIGLLMGWLPVLVSAAIVDRNSVDSEHVAKLLNSLMRRVHPYEVTFTKFVGQGRRRWHYGVAHPVLTMLERFPQDLRRPVDWPTIAAKTISNEDGDWAEMTHGRKNESITYFSKWEFVHMFSAWATIGLSVLGAWYISYNTPTVGLGCRSFSYVMWLSISTFSGLVEILMYPVMYRPVKKKSTGDILKRDGFRGYIQSKPFRSLLNSILDAIDTISFLVLFTAIFMQTTGAFQYYWCRASLIGHSGGYVVFDSVSFIKRFFDANMYWFVGTVVSSVVPVLGITWTTREWLTQSFMWSTDLKMARRGLRRVRVWKGFWWGVRAGGRLNMQWLKKGFRWRP